MRDEKQILVICYQWKTESGALFTHLSLTDATARQFKGCERIGLWELEKTQPWQSPTRGTNVKQVDDMWDK